MPKKAWLISFSLVLLFLALSILILVLADIQTKINYVGWVFTIMLIVSVLYSVMKPILVTKKIIDIARQGKKSKL
ncbi:hypothetical protein [Desulforamulus ruminis]|uniref:Uncharacterized protein n=1 Tax=Desulforamulus ruminis (strain ATCC 23193 / DSM 2154 / NCIMB 8452 / DL) TaxID=696281 RepID=F6DQ52_DESRL|nr:hypothetical protein [Desulforamulus ruminis]AEG61996.1 hypothetical protein Desru_3796 [Desulforamulus ruminis DSM 2154]